MPRKAAVATIKDPSTGSHGSQAGDALTISTGNGEAVNKVALTNEPSHERVAVHAKDAKRIPPTPAGRTAER
jgi:hypothetical protein